MSSYLYRKDFSGGWNPSADAVNCPNNALLRMDNCVLDEQGVVALRKGSYKLNNGNAYSGGLLVRSMYTTYLSGVRYRFVNSNGFVYANDSAISGVTMDATIDVQYTSYLGNVFFSAGTVKKTYNATHQGAWGVTAPSVTPTVATGASGSLTATYTYYYTYYKPSTSYTSESGPSHISTPVSPASQKVNVTVRNPTDTAVTKIYVYRLGNTLTVPMRVAEYIVIAWDGAAVVVADDTTDSTAIINDNQLVTDATVPPDNIIGLSGDYYTRIFALSSDGFLYPSKRIQPEVYATGQAIKVCGTVDSPYWVAKAFGGLYIGTSKDIYRLDGTGAEGDDGSIDFTLTPLNINSPPINNCFAQEGNIMIYYASDGPRLFTGQVSTPIKGETDLLYRKYNRHGVNYVNIEGSNGYAGVVNTSGTAVSLQSGAPFATDGSWSGMTIAVDGTDRVISSVSSPAALTLTGSAGSLTNKVYSIQPTRFRAAISKGILSVITQEVPSTSSSAILYRYNIAKQKWYRHTYPNPFTCIIAEPDGTLIAGDSTGFAWTLDSGTDDGGTGIALEVRTKVDDDGKPLNRKDPQRLRVRCDTGNVSTTCLGYVEGGSSSDYSKTVTRNGEGNSDSDITAGTTFTQVQLKITGTMTAGYYLYEYELEYEELPLQTYGKTLPVNLGTVQEKVVSGFQVRACTLGAARIFTALGDDVSITTKTVTSGADVPSDFTIEFTSVQTFKEFALSVDGNVELYSWQPHVLYLNPAYRRLWDTGPIDIAGVQDVQWVRMLRIKVKAPSNFVVTPYFDGTAATPKTVTVIANKTTIYDVPLGREYKGSQLSVIVDAGSNAEFQPYWLQAVFRGSGLVTEKKAITVKA